MRRQDLLDDEYEQEFRRGGEVEFDELDEADEGMELELLNARVEAARLSGA